MVGGLLYGTEFTQCILSGNDCGFSCQQRELICAATYQKGCKVRIVEGVCSVHGIKVKFKSGQLDY